MNLHPRVEHWLQEGFMGVVRFLVGAYPVGELQKNTPQTLYFANHTSHLDTLTLLAALPAAARARTRPVAAQDYWTKTAARKWIATKMLNVVFIDRVHAEDGDPLEPVREALRKGASLVLFPEGTRTESELPQTFKSGLYYLAKEFPDLNLVPVYLENLHRILPKGSILPVPLINKVHFGPTLIRITGEDKQTFLARARLGVCELSQGH